MIDRHFPEAVLAGNRHGLATDLGHGGLEDLAILRVDLMAVALGVGRERAGVITVKPFHRGRPQDPATRDLAIRDVPVEGPHLAGFQRERESFLALSDCSLGQPVRGDIAL